MPLTATPFRHAAAAGALLAALCVAGGAAASTSGTVRLSGTVNPDCNVSIVESSPVLDIRNGVTSVQVAQVREYCNAKQGFTVTFRSTNNGALVGPGGSRAGYELSYVSSTAFAPLTSPQVYTRNRHQVSNSWNGVWVRMPAQAQATSGQYWDTITVTIAAR